MGKFTFTKRVQVIGWVEDTYEIEADTYEDAVQIICDASDIDDVAEFIKRDTGLLEDGLQETGKSEIYDEEGEVIY